MEIRKATSADLEEIQSIYAYARSFMKANGNPTQWGDSKPTAAKIEDSIRKEKLYVVENSETEKLMGVFYFATEADPTYRIIHDGQWLNDEPYSVVHMVASAEGTKGVASYFMNWVFEQDSTGNIRIDTHRNNKPMQGFLKKMGFTQCGIIYLEDGAERLAYHR